MDPYFKIQNVFERDDETHKLIDGAYRTEEFHFLKDLLWVWTEKVDGTNTRVMWDGKKVTFGGKSDGSQIPATLVTKLMDMFPKENFQTGFNATDCDPACPPICLYGEGYGAKIAKGGGKYIPDGVSFILFDVKIDGWWLRRGDVEDVGQKLGLHVVPEVGRGTLQEAVDYVKCNPVSLLRHPDPDNAHEMEGLVVRPLVQLFDRKGEMIIAKIKCRDF